MVLRHDLSDMLFLRAVYFFSRGIEKHGQDLIGVTNISSTTYPSIGQYDDSITAHIRREMSLLFRYGMNLG